MKLIWENTAWEDYLYWQKIDKRILKRVNELIKSIKRTPFEGIGDPEPLKNDFSGYWSRRVDLQHRLVYHVSGGYIAIIQCRFHYRK